MQIIVADSNIDAVRDALPDAVEKALEAIGLQCEGYAQLNCPVDTGRLRNSITHQVEGDTAYVGTNVEYAPFVEFGEYEHKVGQSHFLEHAVADHTDEYKQIAEAMLKDA